MSLPEQPLQSFAEFWPYYLAEHQHPVNRWLHFAGTALLFPFLVLGLFHTYWWWLVLPLIGYGFAWTGHFFVEHNRPATFRYPLWSLLADFRMFFLMLAGKLQT